MLKHAWCIDPETLLISIVGNRWESRHTYPSPLPWDRILSCEIVLESFHSFIGNFRISIFGKDETQLISRFPPKEKKFHTCRSQPLKVCESIWSRPAGSPLCQCIAHHSGDDVMGHPLCVETLRLTILMNRKWMRMCHQSL